MAASEREIFRDELDEINRQINRMDEKASYSINCIRTCQATIDSIADRISKAEQWDNATNARDMPDSEGFWRDDDGDIWVHDGNPDHNALLLFDPTSKIFYDLPKDNPPFSSDPEGYGPYVRIDNPFIQGEDHAE